MKKKQNQQRLGSEPLSTQCYSKNKIIITIFQYTYNPKMRNKKYFSSKSNFEKLINIMRADIVCTHKPG